jgi:hypothetical protein
VVDVEPSHDLMLKATIEQLSQGLQVLLEVPHHLVEVGHSRSGASGGQQLFVAQTHKIGG